MITGINIVRNCINTGYPFVESILSAYPMCGEYYVNDGGSTDGTLEILEKMEIKYPRLKIFKIPDTENIRWDSVSNQINQMIKQANGGIIFLGNADELIHERDIPKVKQQILNMNCDVLRFDRKEVRHDWTGFGKDVYHPARIARNYNEIRQDWNAYGGDEFLYIHGWPDPERKSRMNIPLFHLYNMFPGNRIEKLRNDAEYLAPGDALRVKTYEALKDSKPVFKKPTDTWAYLPALAKGLSYMKTYRVRECLFNKEWVEKVTGLSYS